MSQYFPKPYKPFGRDINVKINLGNYATKADLKDAKRKLVMQRKTITDTISLVKKKKIIILKLLK